MNFISKETPIVGQQQQQNLLGRGAPNASYIGNVKFRTYINTRKEEYMSCSRHDHKQFIARQVYDIVTHEWNGRFLTEMKSYDANMKTWCIVPEKVAMEKIKQTLRDKGRSNDRLHTTTTTTTNNSRVVNNTVTTTAVTAATASSPPTARSRLSLTGANSSVDIDSHPRVQLELLVRRQQEAERHHHHHQQQQLLLLVLQQHRLAAIRTDPRYLQPEQQQICDELRFLRILQQRTTATVVNNPTSGTREQYSGIGST